MAQDKPDFSYFNKLFKEAYGEYFILTPEQRKEKELFKKIKKELDDLLENYV